MPHPFRIASAYIEAIGSPTRKRYARDYYQWLRDPTAPPAPHPPPGLALLDAVSIRIRLDAILAPPDDEEPQQ